jgi:pimeloyl-ACP methyl ester carboxylesterase
LLEAQLERVAVPVAVVSGASDHIVRPKAARALAGRVKGAELIVLEGGHLLPFERPDLLADVVRRYCAMGLSR